MTDSKRIFYSKTKKLKDSMIESHKVRPDNSNYSIKLPNTEKSCCKRIKNKMKHFNNKNKDFK